MLAEDLPYINLWYFDNVLVHSRRISNFQLSPPGNYDFLTTVGTARRKSLNREIAKSLNSLLPSKSSAGHTVRILFIGDIFGRPGRVIVREHLPAFRQAAPG